MHAYNCFRPYLQYDLVLLFAICKSSYDSLDNFLWDRNESTIYGNKLYTLTMSAYV